MYKCVYKVHSDPVNITIRADSSKKEEEKADQILLKLLTEGMNDLHNSVMPPYAIIHIDFKCEGVETIFMFTGTGLNRLTLRVCPCDDFHFSFIGQSLAFCLILDRTNIEITK